MNTIKILEKQDREIEKLFDQYHNLADTRRRAKLYKQITELMSDNIKIEQTILYPATAPAELNPDILKAIEEHLSVKRVIVDLLEIIHGEDSLAPQLRTLPELPSDFGRKPAPGSDKGMSPEERAAICENIDKLFARLTSPKPVLPLYKSTEAAKPH